LLYIFCGPDDYSLSQALDGLKKEVDTASAFSSGITTLDGHQTGPEQVRSVCAAAPFLSGKRLVVLNGLLEKFEPKGKQGRARKTSTEKREEEYKSFAAVLCDVPESTIIALVEGVVSGNNPLFKELGGKAAVKTYPLLKDTQLRLWIQNRIKDVKASISTAAVDLLVKLVGSNLWVMNNEIEKLALFAADRRIEESDVKTLVSQTEQADVFSMVDAILELRADVASQKLQSLLRRGSAPTYLLFMLCRQIRLIVRARELKKQGASEAEIQARLGVTSSFVIRKTLEQSGRYSLARLREVYRQLLVSDLWIKNGIYDGELAVTILISELCRHRQSQQPVF
jgi:DNA polymerase III subunit delta